jgi:hypothetical protein
VPYINRVARRELRYRTSCNTGELNYEFTRVVQQYIEKYGLSYRAINDVIGSLEGAKQEFYRRVAAPYEDEKLKENGDVYDY